MDATLLRPLPIPQPERTVVLNETTATTRRAGVSPLNLLDWRDRSRSFDAMAAYVSGIGGMVLAGRDGSAETIPRQWVTAGFFDALGIVPIAGRTFQWDDDTAQRNATVLTESFWRTRFGGDASIVGQDIRLDGDPYTVLGVVPDSAQLLGRTSIWALISIQGAPPRARRAHPFNAIGLEARRQPGHGGRGSLRDRRPARARVSGHQRRPECVR
ncbi:MAG: ABC transporter permease [Vicinamibacterales bacterium]